MSQVHWPLFTPQPAHRDECNVESCELIPFKVEFPGQREAAACVNSAVFVDSDATLTVATVIVTG